MGGLERVFHSVLFEALAVTLSVGGLILFTDFDASKLAGCLVLISLIAMVWNFIFNMGFDKIFVGEKRHRSLALRALHAVSFETGLVVITTPILAHMLHTSLKQAFMMDIGVTLFIMFYTIVFNYVYDTVRHRVMVNKLIAV